MAEVTRRQRRRLLPAWMEATGDERAGGTTAPPRSRRRRQAAARPRAAAVYCMNEAELVDVALAVLAENLQCEEDEEKARAGSEEEQEVQPATPKEAPGSTAHVERSSDCSPAPPSPSDTGAGASAEQTGQEGSQDDVLKYVREIFFS
ncbi:cell cycle regulator of non-homologous end joining [Calypte anna]|uniref:cell cycle regulator of non-homologous end joining n=1 Tax=Calypte anna TaxID=9244 RepID=UPI0011C36323|nr:cell cycle regulator of non-homologous end joining [Calypte anna]